DAPAPRRRGARADGSRGESVWRRPGGAAHRREPARRALRAVRRPRAVSRGRRPGGRAPGRAVSASIKVPLRLQERRLLLISFDLLVIVVAVFLSMAIWSWRGDIPFNWTFISAQSRWF